MTSSVAGPRRSSKALPKAKLAPRKGHCYCLVVCCQSGPLQLSESQQKCYIWEACSANRWGALKTAIPTASIGQQNEPSSSDDFVQPVLQKLNKLGNEVCLMCHIHLTSQQPPLLQVSWQLFARKMLPQPAGGRKFFPRVYQILKHGFYTTGIKLISLCVDCNGSCFD